MNYSEIKKAIQKLGETTNYDINSIEIDATKKIYNKYELPSLFIEGEGEFYQGDASKDEIQETIFRINEMFPEMTQLESQEDLFKFLEREFEETYSAETLKVIKEYWIEYYREDIKGFLELEFFYTGSQIGVDWSVFINIETGKIWEHTAPSSNWGFMKEDPDRKLIVHLSNYDKPFHDWTDLIASENKKNTEDNLGVSLPENWEDMDYYDQVEWVNANADKEAKEYNEIVREEQIEVILDHIEDEKL